jgi:predicted transcriptional regulator
LNTVRRSILEIYFDVLKAIDKGTDKPTRIMFEANLSWSNLRRVFYTLIKGCFIREEKNDGVKRYHITEKERNALGYHVKSLEGLTQTKFFPNRFS